MAVAATPRRVGAETSKTRDALLDCVETMMLDEGYASVTYRALATKADVTPSLVQYYFPTLDDIFLAAIQRYAERNSAVLSSALEARSEDPLHALWDFSWDEATGALMTEFMALGNHRKSIQSAIAEVTNQVRAVEIAALARKFGKGAQLPGELSLGAVALLVTGIPKFLNLEGGIGVDGSHREVIKAIENYLDSIETRSVRRKRAPARSRRRA
ncbi:TetR/AcrR family transcriptional regulator [Candidatus Mycobacterium wuenschmannii]|uniref:TetR/AcrR family transcriptional regulator n=1 Tax=Candidatus Mycobacterium wuenschmannii TaxID=3027808 RepID=A0ABY8W3C3_9MYCO|nr:TetR/AcrR family transcriptional regulator [Candidatus Mycobacterium wuenschmannii]WIM90403.1 TetR/AcrR family transcriptional regulator [Candidatus Mycobacterium wuenschmannii]